MKDKRSPIIVVTFVIILILLLLWGRGAGNKTIVNQGDVIADVPRFPDVSYPPLVLPAFGGNRWDWMQTTDCACDCGPRENYQPINISGPSIYIYRAAPAQYNLPSIAPMPAPPVFDYSPPPKETFTFYRDVWNNDKARWATNDQERNTNFGAKEAFRGSDGQVFLIGTKTKVSGVAETNYYFGSNGDLHYRGKTYVHDSSRDRYRWTPGAVIRSG